jgi:hypothetical protein
MNGTEVRRPEMPAMNDGRKLSAYPATRFWITPSSRPPMNASGSDRKPAKTTAARQPSTTNV